jgi:hypothetical protein
VPRGRPLLPKIFLNGNRNLFGFLFCADLLTDLECI